MTLELQNPACPLLWALSEQEAEQLFMMGQRQHAHCDLLPWIWLLNSVSASSCFIRALLSFCHILVLLEFSPISNMIFFNPWQYCKSLSTNLLRRRYTAAWQIYLIPIYHYWRSWFASFYLKVLSDNLWQRFRNQREGPFFYTVDLPQVPATQVALQRRAKDMGLCNCVNGGETCRSENKIASASLDSRV